MAVSQSFESLDVISGSNYSAVLPEKTGHFQLAPSQGNDQFN